MARSKKVLFVRATEHERRMAVVRAELERYKTIAEISTRALSHLGTDMGTLMLEVEGVMSTARRVLHSRNHLRRHLGIALVACGAPNCMRLMYRAAANVGGRTRRCDSCAAEERALFRAARAAIDAAADAPDEIPAQEIMLDDDTPAVSPTIFLADADSTQSI